MPRAARRVTGGEPLSKIEMVPAEAGGGAPGSRGGAFVEDRDGAVGGAAGVVLGDELRARPQPEVAVAAAEPPHHMAVVAVDVVDRARVAARDEQRAVRLLLHRV